MPLRKHPVKTFLLLLLLGTLPPFAAANDNTVIVKDNPPGNGIAEPSIEYDELGRGWMAYTATRLPDVAETRLALSMDNGDKWAYAMTINPSEEGTQISGKRGYAGVWRYEDPSLLFDPLDSEERRWKLFAQRSLSMEPHGESDRLYNLATIEYRTAPEPTGPWSSPVVLFCSGSANCRYNLNRMHPDLADIGWYAETGSIFANGVIYVSLDAVPATEGAARLRKRRIILMSSRDHGANWEYSGTLSNFNDATSFGHVMLTGASLVQERGRIYLLFSPVGLIENWQSDRTPREIIAVEFENIAEAKLQRDEIGRLLVSKRFTIKEGSGGSADYHEQNFNGGIVYSRMNPMAPNLDYYRILRSYEPILTPDTGATSR